MSHGLRELLSGRIMNCLEIPVFNAQNPGKGVGVAVVFRIIRLKLLTDN